MGIGCHLDVSLLSLPFLYPGCRPLSPGTSPSLLLVPFLPLMLPISKLCL